MCADKHTAKSKIDTLIETMTQLSAAVQALESRLRESERQQLPTQAAGVS